MPRKYRLSRADFASARRFSRVSSPLFSLSFGMIPGRLVPGAACIVSLKVARSAVTRNLIRRRVRAALVPLLVHAQTPLVVIVTARKGAGEATAAHVRGEIKDLFSEVVIA